MHPFAMRRAHADVMLAHVSTAEKRLRLIEFAFIRRENFGGTTRLFRNGDKATSLDPFLKRTQPDIRRYYCNDVNTTISSKIKLYRILILLLHYKI